MNEKCITLVNDYGEIYKARPCDILVGISSRVKGRHMPLFDWDALPLERCREIGKKLVRKYNMSALYILKTSRGHRAGISFPAKLYSLKEYGSMLAESECDINFRYFTLKIAEAGNLRLMKKSTKKSSGLALVEIINGPGKENTRMKEEFFRILGWEKKEALAW